MQQTRCRPNILVSGTPGCGKSTTCELLQRHLPDYQYFNISDFAREHNCYDGYDEARKSHIVDEDRLLDELEPLLRRGGAIVDWHVNDIFPERLIDLVVVLRCDNAILHDRLQKRGYHSSKIEENIDAEIMGVVLQDALDSYVREIVVELQSDDTEQMQQNVDRIAAWEANWVSEHPDGVSNALQQHAGSDASSSEADSDGVSDAGDSDGDGDGDSTQDNYRGAAKSSIKDDLLVAMYYVLFECDVAHKEDTPKDHARVSKIYYQLIHEPELLPLYADAREIEVGGGGVQMATGQLEAALQEATASEPFVLCSLHSTWHLRVTLPRQAHDEGSMLPMFLAHAKVFDLWKECDRWCANHVSERACNAGAKGDVAELFRVLDLDEQLVSHAYIQQATRVLLQLHNKCTTAEDQSLVLTHPYDSYADMTSFIQERSEVLYMNNLPPDTTQSELESWFTQFGARPVGFWTVKNVVEDTSNVNNNWSSNNSRYVEEHDSISGFVVFQSHEAASEALNLNGRSILSNMANTKQPRVVEHVVELKPSSSRVLDCAQEILSPFPQSKNKPRPGDWNCPSCGFSNFQRRIACFRCSFPATSAVTVSKLYKPQQQRHYQNPHHVPSKQQVQHPQIHDQDTQQHSQHFNIQQMPQQLQMQQQAHGTVQGGSSMQQYKHRPQHGLQAYLGCYQQQQAKSQQQYQMNQQQVQMIAGDAQRRYNRYNKMVQGNGQNGNSCNGNGSLGSSNVPFRAGDWKCLNCSYHNFAKNIVCLRCGNPKTANEDETQASLQGLHSSSGPVGAQDSAISSVTVSIDRRSKNELSNMRNGSNSSNSGNGNNDSSTNDHNGYPQQSHHNGAGGSNTHWNAGPLGGTVNI